MIMQVTAKPIATWQEALSRGPVVGRPALAISVREESADGCGDLIGVRLEREVAGVQQPDVGVWDVTPEGFGASGQEEWVVAAPDGQQRWPVGPEVLLERGIEVDVARVTEKEVQLNLVRARTSEV